MFFWFFLIILTKGFLCDRYYCVAFQRQRKYLYYEYTVLTQQLVSGIAITSNSFFMMLRNSSNLSKTFVQASDIGMKHRKKGFQEIFLIYKIFLPERNYCYFRSLCLDQCYHYLKHVEIQKDQICSLESQQNFRPEDLRGNIQDSFTGFDIIDKFQ